MVSLQLLILDFRTSGQIHPWLAKLLRDTHLATFIN